MAAQDGGGNRAYQSSSTPGLFQTPPAKWTTTLVIDEVKVDSLQFAGALFSEILAYLDRRHAGADLNELLILKNLPGTRQALEYIIRRLHSPAVLAFSVSSTQIQELCFAATQCRITFIHLRRYYEKRHCYDALHAELDESSVEWKTFHRQRYRDLSESMQLTMEMLNLELVLTRLFIMRFTDDNEEVQDVRRQLTALAAPNGFGGNTRRVDKFYRDITIHLTYRKRDPEHLLALKRMTANLTRPDPIENPKVEKMDFETSGGASDERYQEPAMESTLKVESLSEAKAESPSGYWGALRYMFTLGGWIGGGNKQN